MNAGETIRLTERGYTDIPPHLWTKLASDLGFWRLVEAKVVGVAKPASNQIRLQGKCYVGRAICSDVVIEFSEKVKGALASLIGFATGHAFKTEKADSPSSEMSYLASLLIQQFLNAVREYVSRGRGFSYVQRHRVGSLIGGRLDVPRSIHLRARGFGHLFAFDQNALTYSTPINKILLAAIREVGVLARVIEIPSKEVSRARGLAMLFSDCLDSEILARTRITFVLQIQQLLKSPTLMAHERDLLALAGVVLSHESFELTADRLSPIPRTWFLNLETLFERAVRAVFRKLIPPDWSVVAGGKVSPAIFQAERSEFTAHPDIVINPPFEQEATVGDVKYKTWSGTAVPADLYQLLVHTAAFGGTKSFLVYPGEGFHFRQLGNSATAADTWLFSVDVRHLQRDLSKVLLALDLPFASTKQSDA